MNDQISCVCSGSYSGGTCQFAPGQSQVNGFWWHTYASTDSAPTGTTLSVAFSGWAEVAKALSESFAIKSKLPGLKLLSLGGGNSNGHFTAARLAALDTAVSGGQLVGYDGIVYDVEEGDSGLSSAFKASFANCKAKGFQVLVTVSHSTPYGVSDGVALMASILADPNVDYHSPQLYTSGLEATNDFNENGVPWTDYANRPGKIIPAIVNGARDYTGAQTYFATKGVTTSGFVQWAQA